MTVAGFILIAAGGCSNDPEIKESEGDTQASKPEGPKLSSADVEKFFEGLASRDPETIESVTPIAAEGSVAEAYAKYTLHLTNAAIDAGTPYLPYTVTKSEKGFKSCASPDEELAPSTKRCSLWSGVEAEDGKLASLTVDGNSLRDRISVGTGEKIKLGALGRLEFLSAFQSPSANGMIVNLRLKTKALAVSATEFYSARYRSKDGRQSTASNAMVPDEIAPDSVAYLAVVFDRAKPGGELLATVSDSDYNQERDVTVPTR